MSTLNSERALHFARPSHFNRGGGNLKSIIFLKHNPKLREVYKRATGDVVQPMICFSLVDIYNI